ncbi:MAG: Gfo/Idh/MocA family oxidoreductase [Gemmatimonadota bacterium]
MASRVRIGLLGLGQRGLQHLRALWQIEAAEVVALCDPFPENLEEAKLQQFVPGFSLGRIARSTRFADLMAVAGLDAVYFSIPPNRHDGEVIAAARAGLHIFAEKPVSLYLDEARAMDAAIREAGVISTVGFQMRHDGWHEAARRFLADKRLVMATSVGAGALESHSVKHTRTEELGGPRNRVWAASAAWSGTTVVEAGIHRLDLMRYWAGDVAWVRADYVHRHADDVVDGWDNPCAYSVTFGFECGMLLNLLLTRLRRTYFGDGYEDVAWDHGHLKMEADGPAAYYYEGPYPPEKPPGRDLLRHLLPAGERGDSTQAINQAFVDAVAKGDPVGLRNSFASSMNSHAAVLGANLSDRLGGRKVDVQALLVADEFAPYRRKPHRPA